MRIREWLEWLHANPDLDEASSGAIVRTIAQQTAALAAQVEVHLMGNQLLQNGITLCWAGLSVEGAEALLRPAGVAAKSLSGHGETLQRAALGGSNILA